MVVDRRRLLRVCNLGRLLNGAYHTHFMSSLASSHMNHTIGRVHDVFICIVKVFWVHLSLGCPNKINNYRQCRGAMYVLIKSAMSWTTNLPWLLSTIPHPKAFLYRMLQTPDGFSTFLFLLFLVCGLLGLSPLSISLTCAVATSLRIICLQRSTKASSTFALRLADVS